MSGSVMKFPKLLLSLNLNEVQDSQTFKKWKFQCSSGLKPMKGETDKTIKKTWYLKIITLFKTGTAKDVYPCLVL